MATLMNSSFVKGLKHVQRHFAVYVIQRKFLILGIMLASWLALLSGAIFSPERTVYTSTQLDTHQEFGNETGSMDLVSQKYSKKNGLMVLEFETTDETSSADTGIDANELRWHLYMKDKDAHSTLDVIPTIDNRISVIIRHVPTDFEAMAIGVDNKTVDTSTLNVDSISSSSDDDVASSTSSSAAAGSNSIQFMIVPTSKDLKHVQLKDLNRKQFAVSALADEIASQQKLKRSMQKAITKFKRSVSDSQNQKKALEAKETYLVGQDKTDNESNIQSVDGDIQSKQESITTAKANVTEIEQRVRALKQKQDDVKSGKYKYSASVKEVKLK